MSRRPPSRRRTRPSPAGLGGSGTCRLRPNRPPPRPGPRRRRTGSRRHPRRVPLRPLIPTPVATPPAATTPAATTPAAATTTTAGPTAPEPAGQTVWLDRSARSGCGSGPHSHSSWVAGQKAPARPIRHVWEAPMGGERTSVGLDVHARSVSAAAIDGVTGELIRQRLVPDPAVMLDWLP